MLDLRGALSLIRESKMLKLMQANLHRSRTADSLLAQIVVEHTVDVVIISEQYKKKESGTWLEDATKTAAIWIPTHSRAHISSKGTGNCFVYVDIIGTRIISCYLTPSDNIQTFQGKLDDIEEKSLELECDYIIAGDFNSRAPEWGSQSADSRGRRVMNMVSRLGLVVLNDPRAKTFRRQGCEHTTPDLTLASETTASKVHTWEVCEDYTASDHQYITYSLMPSGGTRLVNDVKTTRGWNTNRLDEEALIAEFDRGASRVDWTADASRVVTQMMQAITKSCDRSMPKRGRTRRKAVYWWNEEISEARKNCLRLRRRLTRSRRSGNATTQHDVFRAARKELRRAIADSKKRHWLQLCQDINENPWGLGYKLVTKKLRGAATGENMDEEAVSNIVATLFPSHPVRSDDISYGEVDTILFTEQELQSAATTLKNKKAPGPDNIPAEVIKAIAHRRPQPLLRMYNACLREGIFPEVWKTQRLVLISKGKEDMTAPNAYRPLCMLDIAGKLLEKLLKPRIAAAIEEAGGLSDKQYGFRKNRSTIGAVEQVIKAAKVTHRGNHYSRPVVLLATIDVKNAFNSARWDNMLSALEDKFQVPGYLCRILRNYLKDRTLLCETSNGTRRVKITAGAAQGSILGPDLWNASYDDILRLEMPEDTFLVGFADDIAAVITARNVTEAQRKLTQVMIRSQTWLSAQGLELATEKTELLLITRRQIPLQVEMRVCDQPIITQTSVRYLGIRLDPKLTFGAHIKYVTEKASKITAALSKLMANINGPRQCKRRLLMEVSHSILLYGCELWADALDVRVRRHPMVSVQRMMALRICSSYRTVSAAASMVIAGVVPIDLLAKQRKRLYELKRERNCNSERERDARSQAIAQWQQRWETESRGRWTAQLIPQVATWMKRKHGEVDYYLTQLLTGHGYFREYLHRMGKCDSPLCIYEDGQEDTAKHTFFECTRWQDMRSQLEQTIGASLTVQSIVEIMIAKEENWWKIARYARDVLKVKKRDLDTNTEQQEEAA